jgi:hypothetical protein
MRVLTRRFNAAEEGELVGPYSVHKYLAVDGLRLGLILDEPDVLYLFARDTLDEPALAAFVTKLLEALNGRE